MRSKTPSPRSVRQSTRRLDRTLAEVDALKRPKNGWIKAIREALSMSQKQLGRRMGISQQAAYELERAEVDGSVTLSRLQRGAEALGCDVVYLLVPREPLEDMLAKQAMHRAEQKIARVNRTQSLEAAAGGSVSMVADLAQEMELMRPSDLWDD